MPNNVKPNHKVSGTIPAEGAIAILVDGDGTPISESMSVIPFESEVEQGC